MAMERTEQIGLGVAVAAHLALLVLLSIAWPDPPPPPIDNPPMAVDLIADAAPVSTAPVPATEPPAARRGEEDSDVREPAPPPPVQRVAPRPTPPPPAPKRAEPVPAPRPTPRTDRRPPPTPPRDTSERRRPDRPASTTRTPPAQTQQPPRRQPQRDTRPAGDPLGRIVDDVARNSRPNARGTNPPATQTASEIRRSISTSINAEVARPWNACRVTGLDVDQLKTTIVFRLSESGGLDRIVSVNTSGVNDTNRTQQARFEECARRAIELAAPFNLPPENYSYWQTYTLDFEKRAR